MTERCGCDPDHDDCACGCHGDCPNCGDDCWHLPGYPWCRPCGEHHRPPECTVDELGRPLMSCGCAWSVVMPAGSSEAAHYAPGCYIVRDRADV